MHCWGQIKITEVKQQHHGRLTSVFFMTNERCSVLCRSLERSCSLWTMPLGIQRYFPSEKQTPKTLHRHPKDILKDQMLFVSQLMRDLNKLLKDDAEDDGAWIHAPLLCTVSLVLARSFRHQQH